MSKRRHEDSKPVHDSEQLRELLGGERGVRVVQRLGKLFIPFSPSHTLSPLSLSLFHDIKTFVIASNAVVNASR